MSMVTEKFKYNFYLMKNLNTSIFHWVSIKKRPAICRASRELFCFMCLAPLFNISLGFFVGCW